jgi:hypothetical protein
MNSDLGGLPGFETKYNLLNALLPPDKTVLSPTIGTSTQERAYRAFEGVQAEPSATSNALELSRTPVAGSQFNVKDAVADTVRIAKEVCEAVKTADPTAFDNPAFAANCGICHKPGKNSSNEPHIGGMLISEQDRAAQEFAAGQLAIKYGRVAYNPTIGSCPTGMFTVDKDRTIAKKERIECQEKKLFSVNNCAQCYADQTWDRVAPNTETVAPKLFLIGSGGAIVNSGSTQLYNGELRTGSPIEITLTDSQEYIIMLRGAQAYIGGYIQGATLQGNYTVDIARLIKVDTVANVKPVLRSMATVGSMSITTMKPAPGQMGARYILTVPFTWVSPNEEAALNCTSPYIRTEAGAQFLESDPCFRRGAVPGSYPLDCLQGKFLDVGCTAKGSSYPATADKAAALAGQKPIGTVAEELYELSIRAATGRTSAGTQLSIQEWSDASMKCTGVAVDTPCDRIVDGKISRDCMQYLYDNRGAGGRIGATYTSSNYSMRDGRPQFCTAAGSAAPAKGEPVNATTVDSLKEFYNTIHARANDNTLTDEERATAINQCYGITLAQMKLGQKMDTVPQESFFLLSKTYGAVNGDSIISSQNPMQWLLKTASCGKPGFVSIVPAADQSKFIQFNKPVRLAAIPRSVNDPEMSLYRVDGCWRIVEGFINDTVLFESARYPGMYLALGPNGMYITKAGTEVEQAHASFKKNGGLMKAVLSNEGRTASIAQQWRKTVRGYDEGDNISCFAGLSLDEARAECDSMDQCTSFSFSNTGDGGGCYKRGRFGYVLNNKGYDGYTKIRGDLPEPLIPEPIKGGCSQGYEYGSPESGYFCCPVKPTNFSHTVGNYTACPVGPKESVGGAYNCAQSSAKAGSHYVCGTEPRPWTSPLIGLTGGQPFNFKCPGDSYITSMKGLHGSYLHRIVAQCSDNTMSPQYGQVPGAPYAVSSPAGFTSMNVTHDNRYVGSMQLNGGEYGPRKGSQVNLQCPPGTRITGIHGRSGGWIDDLGVHCK